MSYTRNQSALQFKRDMQDLKEQLKRSTDKVSEALADELIGNMRLAAPKRTGTLAASIHKVRVVERIGDIERVAYLVIGGGKATTKRGDKGHSYDYAVGTEFGTHKETAEPFFYSTARRYFNPAQEMFAESIDQTIAENNSVRGLKSENASWGADFQDTRGGRGHAVTIGGKQL